MKDSWVHSAVELRLERPRRKSVDVAHLDQRAYKKYMKKVLRAGATAPTQRGRQEMVGAGMNGHEQGKADCGQGNGSRLGSKFARSKQRDRIGSSTATAAALLARDDHHRCVHRNGCSRVGCMVNDGHDPLRSAEITPPALTQTLSCSQLRDGEEGVFRVTGCDAEEAPRWTTNGWAGEGEAGPAKTHPKPFPQRAALGSSHDDSSSAASPTDDALASEALRLRSKGARKVFKQTQRLLGALRTPASSCQTTSTGSRRGGGGGSMGGHPSVVVHHRGGGDAHSRPDVSSFPGRKHEVWRAARGTRPARLAEVFRCVVPPHSVRIECEILLHESLNRTSRGRDGDGGASGGQNGTWDDFVFAWEVSTGLGA